MIPIRKRSALSFLLLALAFRARASAPGFIDQTWFVYGGLGPAQISYPDVVQKYLSLGTRQASFSADLLGIYRPVNGRRSLAGFVVNAVSDTWASGGLQGQANQFTYAFSAWHALNGRLGQGVFMRADLGLANVQLLDLRSGSSYFSPWGLGGALGVGYLFGDAPGHRYAATLLYNARSIVGEYVQTGSLLAGLLW